MNQALILWPLVAQVLLVASRVVHSYIHIGSNYVPNRTRAFKLSLLFVVGLAALLIRALIIGLVATNL
jgi:hypothetical protein